jgi:hypothetical protein
MFCHSVSVTRYLRIEQNTQQRKDQQRAGRDDEGVYGEVGCAPEERGISQRTPQTWADEADLGYAVRIYLHCRHATFEFAEP